MTWKEKLLCDIVVSFSATHSIHISDDFVELDDLTTTTYVRMINRDKCEIGSRGGSVYSPAHMVTEELERIING